MIRGMDTGFLVAAEVVEHAEHAAARQTLGRFLTSGDRIAIAPQVLAEFYTSLLTRVASPSL